jgi:hypothetical protein
MISEEALPTKLDIIEENVAPVAGGIPQGNPAYRVKFKARLQTADVPNNNKRIYPAETLTEVYNQLKPKVDKGKLLGELDHPQVQTSDRNGQLKRSSTILLQNACVHFLDMFWDGKNIDCIAQTTTNRAGLDAYAFIKDGVTVGFSLRAFGDIEKDGSFVKVIPQGLKAITYDFVAMPSHGNALILEFLNESTDIASLVKDLKDYKETVKRVANEKELTVIEEGTTIDNQLICYNGFCSLAPIEETIDYLIDQALKNSKFKKISIKLG